MGKDNTRNDIDGIIRRQIKAGERIFKWLDGVTGENEPFQSVFFEGAEEDKPIMCRMSSMMGRPYRIYTQINCCNGSIWVYISFRVKCSEDNVLDVMKELTDINRKLLYGYFILGPDNREVQFTHAYPYGREIDVEVFKEVFTLYLETVDENYDRIISYLASGQM